MDYILLTVDFVKNRVCIDDDCRIEPSLVAPDVDTKAFDWNGKEQKGNIHYYSGYASSVVSLPEWAGNLLLQ